MRRPRLVYVNLDFPPMSGPGIWRALAFAKYLPEHGFDVRVLCSDRAPGRSRFDPSLLAEVPPDVTVERLSSVFQGDLVARLESLRPGLPRGGGALRRLVSALVRHYPDQQAHWALRASLRAATLVATGEADVVLTSGPPHVGHLAGLLARTVRPGPWVMDYRDLWSDDPVQIKQSSYQQALFERLEAACVARASAVVVVSPGYAAHLGQRFDLAPERLHLVRNGHDVPPAMVERARTPPPPGARLHVHFGGTPQATHPFTVVLDALEALRARDGHDRDLPRVTFTGVPAGFADAVQARGLGAHVEDLGHLERLASLEYSLGCDVLLAMVNARNPLYRGTIPGKVYEALALGRHLLALMPPGSVVGELIADAGEGTLADVSDPADVVRAFEAVRAAHRAGTLNRARSDADHRRVAAKYARRAQAAELAAVLAGVLGGAR